MSRLTGNDTRSGTTDMPTRAPVGVGSVPLHAATSSPPSVMKLIFDSAPVLHVSYTRTATGTTACSYSSSSHSSCPSADADAQALTLSPPFGASGGPVASPGDQSRDASQTLRM